MSQFTQRRLYGDTVRAGRVWVTNAVPRLSRILPIIRQWSRALSRGTAIFFLSPPPSPPAGIEGREISLPRGEPTPSQRSEARIYNGTCEKSDRFTVYATAYISKSINSIENELKEISFCSFWSLGGRWNVKLYPRLHPPEKNPRIDRCTYFLKILAFHENNFLFHLNKSI